MNTEQKEMLERTTALVWDHQRAIQALFEKAEVNAACVQDIVRTTSSSTEIGVIGNEFVKMISLIFLNLTNRLKRNLPEPRVCIYP